MRPFAVQLPTGVGYARWLRLSPVTQMQSKSMNVPKICTNHGADRPRTVWDSTIVSRLTCRNNSQHCRAMYSGMLKACLPHLVQSSLLARHSLATTSCQASRLDKAVSNTNARSIVACICGDAYSQANDVQTLCCSRLRLSIKLVVPHSQGQEGSRELDCYCNPLHLLHPPSCPGER